MGDCETVHGANHVIGLSNCTVSKQPRPVLVSSPTSGAIGPRRLFLPLSDCGVVQLSQRNVANLIYGDKS